MFFLFNVIAMFLLALVEGLLVGARGGDAEAASSSGILQTLYYLASLLPGLAVAVRRMHDSDRSGWWIVVPFVNLVFLCLDGTRGDNRFGADPKANA